MNRTQLKTRTSGPAYTVLAEPREPQGRYAELKAALTIDKHALDEELIRQPQYFSDVSDEYALAISERDLAKDELKAEDARLFLLHKRKAEEDGEKTTQDLLNARVAADPAHARAFARSLAANVTAARWDGLKESFGQRSHALKDLAKLYETGYFGGPSAHSAANRQVADTEYRRVRGRLQEEREQRRGERGAD